MEIVVELEKFTGMAYRAVITLLHPLVTAIDHARLSQAKKKRSPKVPDVVSYESSPVSIQTQSLALNGNRASVVVP